MNLTEIVNSINNSANPEQQARLLLGKYPEILPHVAQHLPDRRQLALEILTTKPEITLNYLTLITKEESKIFANVDLFEHFNADRALEYVNLNIIEPEVCKDKMILHLQSEFSVDLLDKAVKSNIIYQSEVKDYFDKKIIIHIHQTLKDALQNTSREDNSSFKSIKLLIDLLPGLKNMFAYTLNGHNVIHGLSVVAAIREECDLFTDDFIEKKIISMYIEKDYLTVEDAPKVCSLFPDLEQEIRKAYEKRSWVCLSRYLFLIFIVFAIFAVYWVS